MSGRRRARRVGRRLTCEFTVDDRVHRGFVLNLSRLGLYLQTELAVAPRTELDLTLSGPRFPEIRLRARVARRLLVPGPLSSVVRKGVGLALIEPPAEYLEALSQALAGEDEPADAGESFEIEIVVDDSRAPGSDGAAGDPPPQAVAPRDPRLRSRATDADGAGANPAAPEPPAEDGDLVVSEEEWEAIIAAGDEDAPPAGPLRLRCEALVVHTGELADVADYIRGTGILPLEVRPDEMLDLGVPDKPIRLVAMSAATAFEYPLETVPCTRGAGTLALIEGGAAGAFKRLGRQGFDFVVQRPVRDRALRMLVEAMIYRDVEHRNLDRVPVGAPVTFHTGAERFSATLLETSRAGCRLEWEGEIVRGTRLTLRIPPPRGQRRSLKLAGRVLRVERVDGDAGVRSVFSVGYETLGRRTARRLDAFIEARASSLVQLTPLERKAAPAPTALEDLHEERRAHPRRALSSDVVALSDAEHGCAVLLGTELSLGGMYVGPHADLEEGDAVDLEIHSSTTDVSVAVSARVLRDDGPRGLALVFEDLSDDDRDGLGSLLAESGGAIRSAAPGPGAPFPVVVAAFGRAAVR